MQKKSRPNTLAVYIHTNKNVKCHGGMHQFGIVKRRMILARAAANNDRFRCRSTQHGSFYRRDAIPYIDFCKAGAIILSNPAIIMRVLLRFSETPFMLTTHLEEVRA
jgi:hypothetical protein